MKKRVMMAMVVAMGVAVPALAGTTIGYSGQLRNAKGEPLKPLNQQITFTLYKDPTGGEALWSATRNVVLSEEGYYNVALADDTGAATSLESVLQENPTLYIGLKPRGAAAEIAPRQRILETPHAAVAVVAKTGVDGFKVSGTATVTTLAATTVQAGNVQQQYTDGTEVKYGDLLPRGVIVIWNGTAEEIPAGWALCNGQNNTPDLRGRFVVGYDPGDEDYEAVGNKGGAKAVTLKVEQMPKHRHTYLGDKILLGQDDRYAHEFDPSIKYQFEQEGTEVHNNGRAYQNEEVGGGASHENRPPYYTLCYIIKL